MASAEVVLIYIVLDKMRGTWLSYQTKSSRWVTCNPPISPRILAFEHAYPLRD